VRRELPVRIAFEGRGDLAVRVYRYFLETGGDVEVAGWVGELPSDAWPEELPTPRVYPDLASACGEEGVDILFSERGEAARSGTDFEGKITDIGPGSAEALLLEQLTSAHEAENARLREAVRDIGAFCGSVQVVGAYTDPLPKMREVLGRAISVCGAELGFVFLPGEVPGEMEVAAAEGEDAGRFAGKTVSLSGSVMEAVMEGGRSLLLQLAPEDLDADAFLREAGVRVLIAVPLLLVGDPAGVLAVGRRDDRPFLPHHLGLLTVAAAQASLALQVARLYGDLEANTNRDPASGLYNQAFFQSRLQEEVNRARRYSLNVCLLLLELDNFEQYTLRNGRALADLVISDMGGILRKGTREVDVPAYLGEGRFALLLPETRRLGAMRLAERLRNVVEEYPFPARDSEEQGEEEKLTVCVGIASYPASADNDRVLLERAELALKAARKEGPNRVLLYSDNL